MMDKTKKSLRIEFRQIRASLSHRDTKNKAIKDLVLNSRQYRNADIILAYWSVDSEVDTHGIITQALSDGKQVALPKCTDKDGNMRFYYISSLSDLAEGMYGIKDPPENCPAEDFTKVSLCLVPALAFDEEGYRLGYGKGYYDRFLGKFKGVAMGLCFSDCLCGNLPRDSYDKKADYIVTNEKIYDLN
jgi:5-formyltetrahydrofolate cyclo-ligase